MSVLATPVHSAGTLPGVQRHDAERAVEFAGGKCRQPRSRIRDPGDEHERPRGRDAVRHVLSDRSWWLFQRRLRGHGHPCHDQRDQPDVECWLRGHSPVPVRTDRHSEHAACAHHVARQDDARRVQRRVQPHLERRGTAHAQGRLRRPAVGVRRQRLVPGWIRASVLGPDVLLRRHLRTRRVRILRGERSRLSGQGGRRHGLALHSGPGTESAAA